MENKFIEKLTEAVFNGSETRKGAVTLVNMYGWSKKSGYEVLTSGWNGSVQAQDAKDFVGLLKEAGIREFFSISNFSNQLELWLALDAAGLKLKGICEIEDPEYALDVKRWGSSDREEKIPALRFCVEDETVSEIGSLEELSEAITAVANRAVKYGAERTSGGNYIMGHDVFRDLISESDFKRYFDLIAAELEGREELLDLAVDKGAYELDCNFGLAYCPNYQFCEGDEEIFGSFEEWEKMETRPVSQPLSMRRMAEIGHEAILSTKEWFDHPEEELGASFGMTEEEMLVFGVGKEDE